MKPYFRCYYSLWRYMFRLYAAKTKRTKKVCNELNQVLHHKKYKPLSAKQVSRIRGHIVISTITNEWFSRLRGYKLSRPEKRASLYIGAMTPLVDDLMDEKDYPIQQLFAIESGTKTVSSAEEEVVLYCYHKILSLVKNKQAFKRLSLQIANAQSKSKKQALGNLTLSELFEINRNKGGMATLYFRSILSHSIKKDEEKAILLLGEALQLENDVFDVYKDMHQKIETPVLKMANMPEYHQLYLSKIKELKAAFKQLDYKDKNIKRALMSILLVLSRGEVCIQHLNKLQKKENKQIQFGEFRRNQLICDMDKVCNFYKSIQIALKYSVTQKNDFA